MKIFVKLTRVAKLKDYNGTLDVIVRVSQANACVKHLRKFFRNIEIEVELDRARNSLSVGTGIVTQNRILISLYSIVLRSRQLKQTLVKMILL